MADARTPSPGDPREQPPVEDEELDDEYEEYEEDEDLEPIEVTGPTVEAAIESGLDELELERDEVDIEVLSDGTGGQPILVRLSPLPYEDEEEEYEEEEEEEEEGDEFEEEEGEEEGELVGVAPAHHLDPAVESYASLARDVLADLLDLMDLPARVTVEYAELDEDLPSIGLDVRGEYMGILIGRHGDTLSALQFLLGLLVSRQAERRVRVVVDVEGYRERRARLLRDMAMRAAERAARFRQPIFLDPMIPSERRIVHLTLQNHPYVSTHSIGEGDGRRVVVSPKTR
ncbi:MAG: KH domain-containing protein [Chloroflexi bacterium]|nr:KH domain-containing protein [Chloroflexota bacterium]